MIEMKVFGLALDEDTQAPVLVLQDEEDTRTLPIWIGAREAMAISLQLNQVTRPRPMTHDLLLSSITALGGVVRSISVNSLSEGTFYATVNVERGGESIAIDARPSDAVALALRAQAPILVEPGVFEALSVSKSRPTTAEGEDKWADILESFNPSDTKYKM